MGLRIGASSAAAPNQATREPRQVEPQRTPVTRVDLRGAIGRAWEKVTGRAPTANVLDTLTAHASLETGSGAQMYNFNFGGIKGTSPTGETAKTRTKEVIDGKTIEVRDGFRAYRSLDDGAIDYVHLMKDRFGGATARAEAGDVAGFAHALKQAKYYTADETQYATALKNLSGVVDATPGHSNAPTLAGVAKITGGDQGSNAANVFPDSLGLGRVLDAIARHPTTVDEGDSEDD